MLISGTQFLQASRPRFLEFHTRAHRCLFKEKLKNVANVLPTLADMIYQELTLDAASASHPITQEIMTPFWGEIKVQ